MAMNIHKNFYLFSFIPAVGYWYLEANYPIKIAVIGGLLLAILELGLEWYFTKHLHALSKFNFATILVLGGISVVGEEGIWFKLQPCMTGICLFLFLKYKLSRGDGLFWEMLVSMGKPLPPLEIIKSLETHMAYLFGSYGVFMGYVALNLSTDQWLFFKTIGFYIVAAIFMIFEIVVMRRKMKKIMVSLPLRDKGRDNR